MTSTSRFNILKNATNNVSFSSNLIKNSSLQSSSHNNFKANRFVSKHVNEERNKKQKEDDFIKSLDSLTAFPTLQTIPNNDSANNNNNNEKNQSITFIEAMKTKNKEKPNEKITNDDDVVPPGCVCIKYDEATKKQIWIYGKNTSSINNFNNEKNPLEENDDPCVIFQRLVNLHQGRKYDHISKWGIDEYEKMFLYQNYDYEYFDKLDEQIEKNMEKYYQNTSYNLHNYHNDSDNDN
jgi:hypothetical protein